jgi:hypothetical protein
MDTHSPPDVTEAVQVQLDPLVVTSNAPDPPAASKDAVDGVTAATTHGSPVCVITWSKPPTEMVAVRSSVVGFTSTEYSMAPDSPCPDAPCVMVTHVMEGSMFAAQTQLEPLVETVNDSVPPAYPIYAVPAEIPATAQDGSEITEMLDEFTLFRAGELLNPSS